MHSHKSSVNTVFKSTQLENLRFSALNEHLDKNRVLTESRGPRPDFVDYHSFILFFLLSAKELYLSRLRILSFVRNIPHCLEHSSLTLSLGIHDGQHPNNSGLMKILIYV